MKQQYTSRISPIFPKTELNGNSLMRLAATSIWPPPRNACDTSNLTGPDKANIYSPQNSTMGMYSHSKFHLSGLPNVHSNESRINVFGILI